MRDSQYLTLIRVVSLVSIVAGSAARIFDFGSSPPGLNQDEASIGYEAWSLLHYGIDRNGVSWPVHLIAYGGGGSNASYAYLAIPFVAFGLSPLTVRLPMLVSALASLPLIWIVARRLFDENAAWAATAVVALSPWHIMLSRWALDCNVLPFLFLCGLALLITSTNATHKTLWLVLTGAMFGISIYSYGTAYLTVPLFVFGSLVICVLGGILTKRQALVGAASLSIAAIPIALFVLVNVFRILPWGTIVLGGITVPSLPKQQSHFDVMLGGDPLVNVRHFLQLLATQSDGTTYNVTDPYGILYSSVFLALAIGLVVAIPILVARRRWPLTTLFISLWVIACIPTGIVQEPNINRINLLLMGLVFASGLALAAIDKWMRGSLLIGLLSMLALFGFFVHDYFSKQVDEIGIAFFRGLVPALEYAQDSTTPDGRICVSGQVNMPYVYALFTEPGDPHEYLPTVQYVGSNMEFRQVASYGRYTFGLERCDFEAARVVVARKGENVPAPFFNRQSFDLFDVYALSNHSAKVSPVSWGPPAEVTAASRAPYAQDR
jgi:hypothetical protein